MKALGVMALPHDSPLGELVKRAQLSKEQELREPAMTALNQVGLTDRANENAGTMSHGEHRQLEIAMALATHPKLLLLDEPTAGLGPEETKQMVNTGYEGPPA